jgi:chloride channel protein, CIC family
VVDARGRCIGMIARGDLLQQQDGRDSRPLLEAASLDVVTAQPEDSLLTVLREMLDEDVGHIPIVVDDRLVGICTRTDILDARRKQLAAEHLQPGWFPNRKRSLFRLRASFEDRS